MLRSIATLLVIVATQLPATSPPRATTRDEPTPRTGTGVIRGRITERDTDVPVARMNVRLFRVGWTRSYDTRADEQGRFTFTRLPAGEYRVSAEPLRNRKTHLQKAFVEKSTDSGGPPKPIHLSYSDGRTSPHLLRPRGGSWTPKFPRQANPPPHDGLPLSALQVDFEVDREIIITVSLKYGSPHQKTVKVATVRLGTDPVRVSDLERYGVDPIVLSIEDYSPAPLVQPTVTSASPLLDVTVDLMRHDVPLYNVTFRNRAAHAVMAVSFKMLRGDKEVGSGRRKTNRSTPIVDAASEYTFELQVGSGETPGFDRFDVNGVLWDNGSVEGDPDLKTSEQALTFGYAQQLRRVLVVLGDAVPPSGSTAEPKTLAQVRALLEALPIAVDESDPARDLVGQYAQSVSTVKNGQVQVKNAVLQDLDAYVEAHAGAGQASARAWVDEARPRYSSWLRRAAGR